MSPEKFLEEARKFLASKWVTENLVRANKEWLSGFITIVEKKLDATNTRS